MIDRVLLESRWTEIARDSRAEWQMTLYHADGGKRYCEWKAGGPKVIAEILRGLGVKWSEILETEVTSPSEWRVWEITSRSLVLNCWEAFKCGREPGGSRTGERGVCPVAGERGLWGKNRGLYAGRCCWNILGTLCEGRTQATFEEKITTCSRCDFYQRVKVEEGPRFEA